MAKKAIAVCSRRAPFGGKLGLARVLHISKAAVNRLDPFAARE
jgi:hypothetical protein